jgi:branched-chain amino acid aminotransferase
MEREDMDGAIARDGVRVVPGVPVDTAGHHGRTAFGTALTSHLVSARWDVRRSWHDVELRPYEALRIDPAMVGLHYGQTIFEGLKAFRQQDGGVSLFRPDAHARRFRVSARRLLMPELPEDLFVAAADALAAYDQRELPDGTDDEASLYLRPIMFASERTLALRAANEYRFLVLSMVIGRYFGAELRPVRVWVSAEYSRAAPGGTGAVKYAGNYAGAFLAQDAARRQGCDEVVWLDPVERRWVEEMGGMNLFFVRRSGGRVRVVTPPLSGTLLPGITRDSLLRLAPDLGIPVYEEPIDVDDWQDGCRTGDIEEVFACGTAARITPVGEVRMNGAQWSVGDGQIGPVTRTLLEALSGIQSGARQDVRSWMHPVRKRPQARLGSRTRKA